METLLDWLVFAAQKGTEKERGARKVPDILTSTTNKELDPALNHSPLIKYFSTAGLVCRNLTTGSLQFQDQRKSRTIYIHFYMNDK